MKLLYLIKQDTDEILMEVLSAHEKDNDVVVVDLNHDNDYEMLVHLIAWSDKVISW